MCRVPALRSLVWQQQQCAWRPTALLLLMQPRRSLVCVEAVGKKHACRVANSGRQLCCAVASHIRTHCGTPHAPSHRNPHAPASQNDTSHPLVPSSGRTPGGGILQARPLHNGKWWHACGQASPAPICTHALCPYTDHRHSTPPQGGSGWRTQPSSYIHAASHAHAAEEGWCFAPKHTAHTQTNRKHTQAKPCRVVRD
jgi:hypothetical protein